MIDRVDLLGAQKPLRVMPVDAGLDEQIEQILQGKVTGRILVRPFA